MWKYNIFLWGNPMILDIIMKTFLWCLSLTYFGELKFTSFLSRSKIVSNLFAFSVILPPQKIPTNGFIIRSWRSWNQSYRSFSNGMATKWMLILVVSIHTIPNLYDAIKVADMATKTHEHFKTIYTYFWIVGRHRNKLPLPWLLSLVASEYLRLTLPF